MLYVYLHNNLIPQNLPPLNQHWYPNYINYSFGYLNSASWVLNKPTSNYM